MEQKSTFDVDTATISRNRNPLDSTILLVWELKKKTRRLGFKRIDDQGRKKNV